MSIFNDVHDNLTLSRKNKNTIALEIYGLVYSDLKNKCIDLRVNELSDADTIAIIKKNLKQLDEQIEMFTKAFNSTKEQRYQDTIYNLRDKKEILEKLLPAQLSEDKVKEIINSLEDKSIPSVMKHFKTNYNGQVDMGMVSRIAKSLM